MDWGERSNTLASLKGYNGGPVSMPLEQITPIERDQIKSPGSRDDLPR